MELLRRIPQTTRYIAVGALSLICSITGVIWAVHKHDASLGGLGGAVGTAIAFASLLLRPDYGLQIYNLIKKSIPPDSTKIEQLEAQLDAIHNALRINSNGQVIQNWAVAIPSCIGTLFWAFGEYIARWFI